MKLLYTTLIAIILSVFLFCHSVTAQKVVVIEKFTNTACGSCPGASIMLKDIVANNDNVIWVSHYKNNGWFDNPLTNDRTAQLWEDISVPGNPLGMIDRVPVDDYLFIISRNWEDRINEQMNETTDVSVDISNIEYEESTRQLDFDIDVVFDSSVSEGDYRITAMIVEDSVLGQSQNSYFNEVAGHPLEGRGDVMRDYAHPNVVRTILDDTWGTAEVIPILPELGTPYVQHYSYTAPEDYRVEKFKIVCMINKYVEGDLLDRKILNANQINVADVLWQLTDTDDLTISKDLEIYPIPATNVLYVTNASSIVDILDQKGQLVRRCTEVSISETISLSGIDAGIYLLRTEVDGEQVVKKFSVVK